MYNINECIFRAGCNSLPVVKVRTEEDVFLCMVCPVAMLWGFFYFPFIASRQNLCEELFLKIQNKFLGGFLIMEAINVQNKTRFTPKFIASVGILSGISIVLMQILEFPIPFMPPFLKFDFSTLPALIGGFAYGPVTGIAIAFIKAALHLLRTDTGGVGELADFLASGSLVLVSSLIYKRIKTRKGAVLGLVLGAIAMAIVGGLANYFILIPFYTNVMPMEQIISLCGKANPLITNTLGYVLYGAIPFNLIKALLLSIITFVLYKQISKILH